MWSLRRKPKDVRLYIDGVDTIVQHRLLYLGKVDGIHRWHLPVTLAEASALSQGRGGLAVGRLRGRSSVEISAIWPTDEDTM